MQPPSGTRLPGGWFFLCLWLELWSRRTRADKPHRKTAQKVKKNRRFLLKTAVFVVDDTGLEPVTPCTSNIVQKTRLFMLLQDLQVCALYSLPLVLPRKCS